MIKVETDERSGFCAGVIRAISSAERFLSQEGRRLWSLGAIVHNEEELARLCAKGLEIVGHDELDKLSEGDTVLIRAHGEPPQTYDKLGRKGLQVIDCTCPVVLKLQQKIWEASRSSQVLIFGKVGHPEVLGLVGQTAGKAIVFENEAQLQSLLDDGAIDTAAPTALFSQTTMSPEDYAGAESLLRTRLRGPLNVNKSICAQVASRHGALAEFAARHDVIIFVSGSSSSNGKVLFNWCRECNPRSHRIGSPEELRPEWFEGAENAGVCGATSTPKWLLEKVAERIENLQ